MHLAFPRPSLRCPPRLLTLALSCTRPAAYNPSTAPSRQRLGYHGPFGVGVSWYTTSQLTNHTVRYGLDPHTTMLPAHSNNSVTYLTSSKWNSRPVLDDLLPSTNYYQSIVISTANETYRFTTACLAADLRRMTVGLVADMGTLRDLGLSDHCRCSINGRAEESREFAALSPLAQANCDNGWQKGFTKSNCPQGHTNFTDYTNRFRMPSAPDESQPGAKYHKGSFSAPNQQLDFIKPDLAKVGCLRMPWVVAVKQRPWYTAADVLSLCTTRQLAFEPLPTQYGVDIVLQSHVQISMRIPLTTNNKTDPNGRNNPSAPSCIIFGAAGHFYCLDAIAQHPPAFVTYAQHSSYAFSRLTGFNRTHLMHEFAGTMNRNIIDSAVLYKEH
ncbi:hypothetical protein K437DRAFT_294968 [Tilletiaria anomala UBC 951]|uniref:Purple acid phosphatase C-terminal domain-containing protein n=1 Tax=Tilletiaria anomala (strain ATCC 24038 / CBS 436.72 / UBC 951) TaxID=1037660 RepID=A0A066VQR9_TILAU|nr:uncharacterized protein K437DRAFT_294968 [Tilletiaria anomala UBC 951]KDN44092.1 hypothetical protein K437DRAFT_294968 [Tilletiaria anomala UBC 951]